MQLFSLQNKSAILTRSEDSVSLFGSSKCSRYSLTHEGAVCACLAMTVETEWHGTIGVATLQKVGGGSTGGDYKNIRRGEIVGFLECEDLFAVFCSRGSFLVANDTGKLISRKFYEV